jgi:trehalose 6-phosphate phosphatase
VAIVSGRPIDDLRRLVPEVHFLIGLHGVEVAERRAPARLRFDVREADTALARLKKRLAAAELAPARLEDKGHALALHVRGVSALAGRAAVARFLEALEAERKEGAPLEALHGRAVVEARPVGARKDLALADLLESLGHPAFAFAGDDVTDEQVFAAFPAGLTIAVMDPPRDTLARTYLRSPAEVARAIDRLRGVRAPLP